MKQYEALNPEVRDQFNRKFINQLESEGVISLSDLLADQEAESSRIVQGIFPPEQYGDYDQLFNLDVQSIKAGEDEDLEEAETEEP